jgi:hypothetical protein
VSSDEEGAQQGKGACSCCAPVQWSLEVFIVTIWPLTPDITFTAFAAYFAHTAYVHVFH